MASSVCPSCRKDAPIVMRGIKSFCSVCGAPRLPLEQMPVNVAGKPSKVGGTVVQALGWFAATLGTLAGLFLYWLFGSALEWPILANYVAIPFTVFWLLVGGFTIFGGKKLKKSGVESEHDARERAIFSLADARGGRLVVDDVAAALGMTKEEAEAQLTELAKRHDDRVSLEVTEDGQLYYDFRKGVRTSEDVWQKLRVADDAKKRVETGTAEEAEAEAEEPGAPPRRLQR